MNEVNQREELCPLCGGENLCAIAAGEPPGDCWCHHVTISQEALSAVPPESKGRRCLCRQCGGIGMGIAGER